MPNHNWIIRATGISTLSLLVLGNEVCANPIQWDVIRSEPARSRSSQMRWIDPPEPHQLPPIDQNSIVWTEVEPNEPEHPTNQIDWEIF